jgi:hypothetical protein
MRGGDQAGEAKRETHEDTQKSDFPIDFRAKNVSVMIRK